MRKTVDSIFQLEPGHPTALRIRLFVLESAGRVEEALKLIQSQLRLVPKNTRLYFEAMNLIARNPALAAYTGPTVQAYAGAITDNADTDNQMAWMLLTRQPGDPEALKSALMLSRRAMSAAETRYAGRPPRRLSEYAGAARRPPRQARGGRAASGGGGQGLSGRRSAGRCRRRPAAAALLPHRRRTCRKQLNGNGMKEKYRIVHLPKEKWQGTVLPIGYTTQEYYDVAVDRQESGFTFTIRKKTFDRPVTLTPEEYDCPRQAVRRILSGSPRLGRTGGRPACAPPSKPVPKSGRTGLLVTELWIDAPFRKQGLGHALMEVAEKAGPPGTQAGRHSGDPVLQCERRRLLPARGVHPDRPGLLLLRQQRPRPEGGPPQPGLVPAAEGETVRRGKTESVRSARRNATRRNRG